MISIKEIENEFRGLEVLSYERMVELLNDQEKRILISFTSYKDERDNGKEYHYIDVRDLDKDKYTLYAAPDQDDEVIGEKLLDALDKSPISGEYGYYDNEWCVGFVCTIGKNRVDFPVRMAKKMVEEITKPNTIKKLKLNKINFEE